MSDFNYLVIDWKTGISKGKEDQKAFNLNRTTKEAYLLIQHKLKPTKHRNEQKQSLDDLVLTIREDIFNCIEEIASLGKSDHGTLFND